MASFPILSVRNLHLQLGAKNLFSGVNLQISMGERWVLVGRNGSGKSTLLKIMAGLHESDGGEIVSRPGLRTAYMPQDPDLTGFKTVSDYVLTGLKANEQDLHYRAHMLLTAVKLNPLAAPADLSGGEARRAALVYTLMPQPDLLLLDEPTNHMDLETIIWLEKELKSMKAALVIISHDRAFLDALGEGVFWLDRGILRQAEQPFARFESWSEQILEEESQYLKKLDKRIEKETAWSHQGITARRKRNQGRLRKLHEMRITRNQFISRQGSIVTKAETGELSGKLVIEAKSICKGYKEHRLFENFSLKIMRGERIALIGPNGAGKTTLIKTLTGQIPPDRGSVHLGTNLSLTLIDQNRSALDENKTIWETLADMGGDQIIVRGQARHVVGYMQDFLFDKAQAHSPITSLSGGERNRLVLAKALANPSNVLILDEPTNDLDIDTLDLLQEILADYEGTLLLVSHDRDFIDRIATTSLVFDGEGNITPYIGGYSDYQRLAKSPSFPPPQTNKPQKQACASEKNKKALTLAEQKRLKLLPIEIDKLNALITKGEKTLSDPRLYEQGPEKSRHLAAQINEAKIAILEREEEWLALLEKSEL